MGHFQRKLCSLYCACPTKEILGLSDLSVSEAHICLNNVSETWSLCTEWRGKALICVLSAMSITYLNSRSNFVTKRKEMLSNWFENKPGVQSCLSDSLTPTASGMRVISPSHPITSPLRAVSGTSWVISDFGYCLRRWPWTEPLAFYFTSHILGTFFCAESHHPMKISAHIFVSRNGVAWCLVIAPYVSAGYKWPLNASNVGGWRDGPAWHGQRYCKPDFRPPQSQTNVFYSITAHINRILQPKLRAFIFPSQTSQSLRINSVNMFTAINNQLTMEPLVWNCWPW